MKPCLFVFIAFATIVALVIFIKYLRNLHTRISRLENKAAPHLEIIEREIHGFGFYLRIIVGIAIFFCVGICVHYLCYCHPRLISSNAPDYMGTLVGISTILVTLLVGWQIFSNIREREQIDKLNESNNAFTNDMADVKDKLDARINKLEECCEERKQQIEKLNTKIEYTSNATLLIIAAKGLLKSANFENKEKRTDAYLVSSAYATLYQALYQLICAKSDMRNIRGCISELKTCIMMLGFDELKFIKEHYDRAYELYNEIITQTDNSEILSELHEINNAQKKIGWDEIFEKAREYFDNIEDNNLNSPTIT